MTPEIEELTLARQQFAMLYVATIDGCGDVRDGRPCMDCLTDVVATWAVDRAISAQLPLW